MLNNQRLKLDQLLVDILGSNEVYFQPPETIRMKYPSIVYSLEDMDKDPADNTGYIVKRRYSVVLIARNPDTSLIDKLLSLPYSSFSRHYTKDNLNHYIFSLYY